jgi:hypothetical protein
LLLALKGCLLLALKGRLPLAMKCQSLDSSTITHIVQESIA